MRDPNVWTAAKHVIGAAVGVRHWPSRRYMRRLKTENDELRRSEHDLRGCTDLAAACSKAILQRAGQL